MSEKLRAVARRLLIAWEATEGSLDFCVAMDDLCDAMAEPEPCQYPDCVDNGPDGKCTRWLLAECERSEDFLRLAQPVQEPVAWLDQDINCAYTAAEMDGDSTDGLVPLYAHPPQRPLLTDEEIDALALEVRCDPAALRSAIERKVRGEKE